MQKMMMINASAGAEGNKTIHANAVAVNWLEAAADDEEKSLPKFEIDLYNGGILQLAGWYHPMVVDLKGVKVMATKFPALMQHNHDRIVGHCEKAEITSASIKVNGVISASADNKDVKELRESSANGFPWQASMGAAVVRREFVEAGKKVTVNGKTFTGPLIIARESILREASFVAIGADTSTSAKVSANANYKESNMKFETWLLATYGIEAGSLTPEQMEKFKGLFASANQPQGEPAQQQSVQASSVQSAPAITLEEMRAESARVADINARCKDAEICAQAIKEGWTADKAELASIKKVEASQKSESGVSGVSMFNAGASNPQGGSEIIQAATAGLMLRCGLSEKEIGAVDKIMEAGRRFQTEPLTFICAQAVAAEGMNPQSMTRDEMIRAAMSTKSLSNILNNVVNKQAAKGYLSQRSTWRKIARKGTLADFKPADRIMLYNATTLQPLAPDGRIKSGKLGDAKESIRATRYATKLHIDEQTMKDDNLDMLIRIPRLFGAECDKTSGKLLYTHILSNPTMRDGKALFHADHNNLLTTNALSIDAVGKAIAALRKMTADNGDSCEVEPYALVVPPELEQLARSIVESQTVVIAGGSTKSTTGSKNIISGYNLEVVVEGRLSNTNYEGNSATTWYLTAHPEQYDTFEVGFVDGIDQPIAERLPAGNDSYGSDYRIKLDVGAKALDWRGTIKNTA